MNKRFAIKQKVIGGMTVALLSSLTTSAIATVGGGQTIEFLGYDSADKKVYVLRHYHDARGRLPQLYYYNLKAKNPQNLVKVDSIYINPTTKRIDVDDYNDTFFKARLDKIKQRVIKLKSELKTTHIDVKSISQHKENMTSWLGDAEGVTQYRFNYRVLVDGSKYASALQTIDTYSVCLNSSYHIYPIPNQPYMVGTVTYMGTLMEGGYNYQDPVLLKR